MGSGVSRGERGVLWEATCPVGNESPKRRAVSSTRPRSVDEDLLLFDGSLYEDRAGETDDLEVDRKDQQVDGERTDRETGLVDR